MNFYTIKVWTVSKTMNKWSIFIKLIFFIFDIILSFHELIESVNILNYVYYSPKYILVRLFDEKIYFNSFYKKIKNKNYQVSVFFFFFFLLLSVCPCGAKLKLIIIIGQIDKTTIKLKYYKSIKRPILSGLALTLASNSCISGGL